MNKLSLLLGRFIYKYVNIPTKSDRFIDNCAVTFTSRVTQCAFGLIIDIKDGIKIDMVIGTECASKHPNKKPDINYYKCDLDLSEDNMVDFITFIDNTYDINTSSKAHSVLNSLVQKEYDINSNYVLRISDNEYHLFKDAQPNIHTIEDFKSKILELYTVKPPLYIPDILKNLHSHNRDYIMAVSKLINHFLPDTEEMIFVTKSNDNIIVNVKPLYEGRVDIEYYVGRKLFHLDVDINYDNIKKITSILEYIYFLKKETSRSPESIQIDINSFSEKENEFYELMDKEMSSQKTYTNVTQHELGYIDM